MHNKNYKFQFDRENNFINTDENEPLLRQFVSPNAAKINIELIEISNIDNPSDITIEIIAEQIKKRTIYFYKHREKFILQNNLFILDTKELSEFKFNIPDLIFSIKVICNNNFKMTMYYSTDQKSIAIGYQEL